MISLDNVAEILSTCASILHRDLSYPPRTCYITPSIHCGARSLSFISFRVNSLLVSDFMSLSLWMFSEPPRPNLGSLSLSLGPPGLQSHGCSYLSALKSPCWVSVSSKRLWILGTRASFLHASQSSVPTPARGSQGHSVNICWTNEWISGFSPEISGNPDSPELRILLPAPSRCPPSHNFNLVTLK